MYIHSVSLLSYRNLALRAVGDAQNPALPRGQQGLNQLLAVLEREVNKRLLRNRRLRPTFSAAQMAAILSLKVE